MLGSLSIGDNSETCNEVKDCSQDRAASLQAPSCGTSPASSTWEEKSTELQLQELWRPSPKVAGGAAVGEGRGSSLCELGALAKQGNLQPRGKVVFILEKLHKENHMGSLVLSSPLRADGSLSDRDSFVMFHPEDRRFPHMLIARGDLPSLFVDNPGAYAKSIFMACVKSHWAVTSKLPWGHNVHLVGETGAINPETEALLSQNGVDHGDFPHTVLQSLEAYLPEENYEVDIGANTRRSKWKIPDEEIAKRRDLRNKRIFTIDPTYARDLDDALSVTLLADGTVEIGVHIADVTFFVKPNSDLDTEARRRATTVYLVQRAIPMLPPLLCETLCALHPYVDRLAYSCIWKMNANGTRVDEPPWFGRTVIRSCCKLDYQTAQRMIDGSILPDNTSSTTPDLWDPNRRPKEHSCEEVCSDVLLMHTLARERRAKRYSSGLLSLNTPKLSFTLDENGITAEVGLYPIRDSNKLVEEYMILANVLVAEQMIEAGGDKAFLRMHPPPLKKGMQELQYTLAECGFEVDVTSSASLQTSLQRIHDEYDEDIAHACTMMATIPMDLAEYVVGHEAKSWRHYAMNLLCYTHFTSPIRRYADVMVHRVLTATLEGSDAPNNTYDAEAASKTANYCNAKRQLAKSAQERSDEVFLAVYAQSNTCVEEAVVTGINKRGFTVYAPRLAKRNDIPLDTIPDIEAAFNSIERTLDLQATSTVTHQWTTATIRMYTKVVVRVEVSDMVPIKSTLVFLRPI